MKLGPIFISSRYSRVPCSNLRWPIRAKHLYC